MVTLVILDGFGEKKEVFGNAIKSQGTPNLDILKKQYPHTLIEASGEAVGLPKGVMGNSEAGHLMLGSGRVILQDLMLIDSEIKNGNFFKNPALIKALTHAEKNKSNLHLMGIMSNGRVHSDIAHMFAILDFAKNFDIKNIYIHIFTDGRDTGPHEAIKFIKQTEEKIKGTNAKFGTLIGRAYLDRENRWDRVKTMYDLLVDGVGEYAGSAEKALEMNYARGLEDEFMDPMVIDKDARVQDNDSLIFYDYRTDREREITFAFTDEKFSHFKTKKLKNFLYTTMTQYAVEFAHLNTLFPPKKVDNGLSKVLSQHGKTQFHTSETTKYAHVTFFFNGGIEKPYEGEDRKLVDSIDVKNFSEYPNMRAPEITQNVLEAIKSKKYDFILVNLSNPDMIGHTGDFEATKQAIKCVDELAYKIAMATLEIGGDCIITADHGNAEEMFDKDGNKLTKHTTNPVPVILVSEKNKKVKLKKGKSLTSIAPTVLKLLDIEKPAEFDEPLF